MDTINELRKLMEGTQKKEENPAQEKEQVDNNQPEVTNISVSTEFSEEELRKDNYKKNNETLIKGK